MLSELRLRRAITRILSRFQNRLLISLAIVQKPFLRSSWILLAWQRSNLWSSAAALRLGAEEKRVDGFTVVNAPGEL